MDQTIDIPDDLAEVVFDTSDAIPLTELADSFRALDNLFARASRTGARLAVAELRKGSIVALLAPFVPVLGQSISFMSSAVDVSDFIKRLREALNAFAGVKSTEEPSVQVPDAEVAAEIAALVKPLAGRQDSRLDVAHIKYRSSTSERVVEIEATYGPADIDRIAVNAAKASELTLQAASAATSEPQQLLKRGVVLTLQQTNTLPAREKGKTSDRGIIEGLSEKPLAVYFAKTIDDLKQKIVGRSANPFRQPFKVDVLVSVENGEPKSYTVIDVHGPFRPQRKRGPRDLLTDLT